MGSYSVVNEQAKINHVYTPNDSRGKGYAANLIYEMTKMILDLGLVPLLYTDYNYIASNKAYINAGYEDKGINIPIRKTAHFIIYLILVHFLKHKNIFFMTSQIDFLDILKLLLFNKKNHANRLIAGFLKNYAFIC